MEILFWILVGGVICFIAVKAVELNKKSETPTGGNTGGGGSTGVGPDVAGELPKENKK